MNRIISALALAASFTIAAAAQSVATPPVDNIYMAGLSGSPGASPAIAGTFLYGHRVTDGGLYAFTMIDALPNTTKPFTVTSNVAVGVAQKVATIAGVDIFTPVGAGVSWNGPNVGFAWNAGVIAPIRIKNTDWFVAPTARMNKSSVSNGTGYQPILGVMVGWGQ